MHNKYYSISNTFKQFNLNQTILYKNTNNVLYYSICLHRSKPFKKTKDFSRQKKCSWRLKISEVL